MIRSFFTAITRDIVGLIGAILTTVSAVLFITLLVIEEFGQLHGAYTGIIAFIVVPGLFVLGLVIMPVGVWRFRRAEAKRVATGQPPSLLPVVDLNVPHTRNIFIVTAVLTLANVVIVATGTYKGIEVMETTQFCGGACHSVMSPEFTTYSRSPHSRVRCTQCHIGPGANWFVKSKISGSWQLISVAFDLYPRPIPTPVKNLRPARETCEQCHWPTKFAGDRLKVITHFDEDEKNTEKKTVLMMKVGGLQGGKGKGIHWHVDPANEVRYRADEKRRTIAEIDLKRADGRAEHYTNQAYGAADAGTPGEWRTMDCVDCHNRPTHVYQRPRDEMDNSMALGELDKTLPFLRREGLRIIQLPFASHEAAQKGIKDELTAFYAKELPELAKTDAKRIDDAAEGLFKIYARNVFPQMKIQWGTYPSFRYDEGGCFRCHQSDMVNAEGKKVPNKCDLCHETLAESEENPEILESLQPQ